MLTARQWQNHVTIFFFFFFFFVSPSPTLKTVGCLILLAANSANDAHMLRGSALKPTLAVGAFQGASLVGFKAAAAAVQILLECSHGCARSLGGK